MFLIRSATLNMELSVRVQFGVDVASLDLFTVDPGDLGVRNTKLILGQPDDRLRLPGSGVVEGIVVPAGGLAVCGASIAVLSLLGCGGQGELGRRGSTADQRRRGVKNRLHRESTLAEDVESDGADPGNNLDVQTKQIGSLESLALFVFRRTYEKDTSSKAGLGSRATVRASA